VHEAITAQLASLDCFHTFDRFTNDKAEQLCRMLADLAPMPDARVFLASGGSEAVDTAIKLARLAHYIGGAPERTVVISRTPSYHGVAYGGMTATGLPLNKIGFGPLLPDIVQVPAHDLAALDEAIAERPGEIAAVIAEPVIGAGGVYPPHEGELQGLRERCDRAGAFLILDEVICGFGRLGRWWAAQHYGVVPDLVSFAKGVTSGYQPLGGVLVGPAVRQRLESDPTLVLRHGYTYSGHPVSCAAGVANLAALGSYRLFERVAPIGERLSSGIRQLIDGDRITGVRGDGAMWAAVLGDGVPALDVREELLNRGVISRPIGESVIAFCPPLVIEDADLDQCVEALGDAVKAVR
jgi:putrescine---pyruvate transaminase